MKELAAGDPWSRHRHEEDSRVEVLGTGGTGVKES